MKIQIPSEQAQMSKIEHFIDTLSEKHTFSDEVYANILLAVTEAVSNAILHGNKCDASKIVEIEYEHAHNFVVFKITDQGEGFKYWNVPDPTSKDNLEKEDGRGIFIMNSMADEMVYNDLGNEVSLKFFY